MCPALRRRLLGNQLSDASLTWKAYLIEDIFGLAHLGDAAMPQVKPFGADVFTKS